MHRLLLCIGLLLFPIICFAQKMPECWYRSVAALENGQLDKANSWADSCLSANQKSVDFLLIKGKICYSQRNYQDAIRFFNGSERIKKGSGALYLAKCYCQLGDATNALNWIELHLSASLRVKESEIKLDPVFENISETKQWKNLWIKEWYTSYERLITEIEYLYSKGSYEEALELIDQKLTINGRYQLYAWRSKVYLKLGSTNLALKDIDHAIRKAKRNSELYLHRANIYLLQNKYSYAIKDIKKALDIVGKNPKYLRELANAQFLLRNFQDAYENLVIYLDYYPADLIALSQKVECAIELGYMVDALYEINRLIRSDGGNKRYRYLRALSYLKTQNYQFALDDFSYAIDGSYMLADSYYYRGICKLNVSKKEEACDDWNKALQQGKFEAQELLYKHCSKSSTPKR